MAGVKVTDLPTLSSASSDDIIYIVDATSTQSKQIELQNIYDGMPQFSSGAFTPITSNESVIGMVVDGGMYSRVGDIVTMSFRLSFNLDVGQTTGGFNFSLPIATTFTTRYQLMGIAKFNNSVISDNNNYVIEADYSITNLGIVSVTSSLLEDSFQDCEIMVQYQIL